MTVGFLDIRPLTYPKGLREEHANGKLPLSLLTEVGPRGWLYKNAARAYKALAFQCMAIGLPLTYTYGGTYRTYDQQEATFRQRYTRTYTVYGHDANSQPIVKTKTWNDETWYQMPKTASAAVPGRSNHGWGLAIDVAFDVDVTDGIGPDDAVAITGHPQWPKFKELVVACGFAWEMTSEPWHIHYCLGDAVSQMVLDTERLIEELNKPPAPPHQPEEEEPMFTRVIQVGEHRGTAALLVIAGIRPHMIGLPDDRDLRHALNGCDQEFVDKVSRTYYVDQQTRALQALNYSEEDIARITGAVPEG